MDALPLYEFVVAFALLNTKFRVNCLHESYRFPRDKMRSLLSVFLVWFNKQLIDLGSLDTSALFVQTFISEKNHV